MRLVVGRLLRNAACSLGILAVFSGITFGLPALDRRVADSRPVEAGQPYLVGAGFTVMPPSGAWVDLRDTRPGPSTGKVVFLIGPVRYAIGVASYRGDLDAAADRLRTKLRVRQGYRAEPDPTVTRTDTGLRGRTGELRPGRGDPAPPRRSGIDATVPASDMVPVGRYTLFQTGRWLVEVVVTSPEGMPAGLAAAIQNSIASIRGPS